MFLPPATKLAQGYIFTGVCDSVHTGGVCVFPGGHAWLPGEVCMVAGGGGMHGCQGGVCGCQGVCMVAGGRGHVWLQGDMWLRGACMAPGGMHGGACLVARGHAWLPGGMHGIRDTVNEWVVRILLECILVTRVCDSVHRGGLPHCMLGYTPPRTRGSHPSPRDQAPPLGPEAGTPQDQTPPSAVHAGRYGQQAGGTHPTGMQSCLTKTIPPGTLSAAFQYKIVHFFHTLMYHNSQY